jgi:hypothetical protein
VIKKKHANTFPPLEYKYSKNKVKAVAAIHIAGYSGSMFALYHAWYKAYPQSRFHFFNDMPEWKQMDKVGHIYSAYTEGLLSLELWRWSGINRNKRILLAGISGITFQTVVEILDGFSKEWGWSWGDFGANLLGSGLLVSQECLWNEQKIQMKWSFQFKRYNDADLNNRSDKLFGTGKPERFLKDYNGQTYWFSTGLHHLFPNAGLPKWLQISIGTGVEGVFGARDNYALDNNQVIFDRTDVPRIRQWYLAPDIDLTKIKTRKKGIRMLLTMLNVIKFPAPALELRQGKLYWNWIAF